MCFLSVLPIPTFSRTRGYAHHLLQAVFLRYCHMYLSDSETCISPAHPYFLPDEGGTIIICVTAAPASSNLPPLHIASTFQSTSCILVASLDRSSIYVSMQEGTHHHRTSSSSGSDLGGCFGHLIDPWSQSRHTWSPWVSLAVALCPVTRPPNEQSNHYKHPLLNRRRGGS